MYIKAVYGREAYWEPWEAHCAACWVSLVEY